MEARQLRILRELGDLGSVTAVAQVLHVTPSAVSQQLRFLQRAVPVPLTRREGRGLRLTAAGETLARAAIDVEVALARAADVVQDISREPAGTVTVSAFSSAAVAYFPSLARAFPSSSAAAVALSDQDVAQEEFAGLTATHDIVLAHRVGHTPHWPQTLRVATLLREPLDVAMPADHPLAARSQLRAVDVATDPWITTHEGFPVGALAEAIGVQAGHPVRIDHHVNEFTVVAELVRAGAGLGLIPRWTVPAPAGVVLRPLADLPAARDVDALVRPENSVRPDVSAVLTELGRISQELAA